MQSSTAPSSDTAVATDSEPDTGHPATADGASGDPRVGWSSAEDAPAPALRQRRDGILPTVAAALSVRGTTLTSTAARGEHAPPCTPSSRTSSTPSPAPSATASPDAAPKRSSSPATSRPPTRNAPNEPAANP